MSTMTEPKIKHISTDEWVSLPEALRLSGLGRTSLYRYMDAGRLPFQVMARNGRRLVKRGDALALRDDAVLAGPLKQTRAVH